MHHHVLSKLHSSKESVHLNFFISWRFSCQVPDNIFRNAAQYKLTNACILNYVAVSSCSAKHFFVIIRIPALQWYCQGWFQPWVAVATLIQLCLSLGHLHCIPTFPMLPMSCEMACNQNIKTCLMNLNQQHFFSVHHDPVRLHSRCRRGALHSCSASAEALGILAMVLQTAVQGNPLENFQTAKTDLFMPSR